LNKAHHRPGRKRSEERRAARKKAAAEGLTHYQKKLKLQKIEREEPDNMHAVHVTMVVVYFASCLVVLNAFLIADLNTFELIRLICLMLAISFFIPIKVYRRKFTMSMYEYILLNLIGISPLFMALFLGGNWMFKGEAYEESYRIEEMVRDDKSMILMLENDAYQEREFLRTLYPNEEFEKEGTDNYSIYFADGPFGVRFIEGKKLH
jgi:hypothetical protein